MEHAFLRTLARQYRVTYKLIQGQYEGLHYQWRIEDLEKGVSICSGLGQGEAKCERLRSRRQYRV